MNLLLIGNYLQGTGFNRGAWHEIADHLRAAGHQVITTSSRVNKVGRLAEMLAAIWQRRKEYQIAQIDVFSGPAFVFAEGCAVALKALHKPFVLTLHGGSLPAFAQKHPARVRRLLASARAVTTPSRYLLEKMAPHRQDLILIPNPLEIGQYPYRERSMPKPALVWLRAFHRIYNPTLAPRALAGLAQDFPEIHLTMVGPDKGGGSLQATERLTRELGLAERVEFPGGVPKSAVPQWLNRGDIFLNTTNIDNTPVSVMEAMACGLCVVSTNVGGMSYLIEDGIDGLLVTPDDPAAMAAAVRRVLTEPGLAARLSVNARKKAEQFDWAKILSKWECLFRNVISNAISE